MELFDLVVSLAATVYLLFIGLTMQTKNLQSAMIFNFIPVVLGIAMVILVLKSMGYIISIG